MRQIETILKGNKEILYLNFSGLRDKDEILKQLNVFGQYITKQALNSQITLTNLEGMHFNTEIYNAFTNYVKKNNPFVKQSVVIGLKGMMLIFYKGFVKMTGRNVIVCSSYNEAINELLKVENNITLNSVKTY